MNRIRKVKKSEFRFNLYSSDLKSFDKKILFEKESSLGIVEGIIGIEEPILIFDTYDPYIKYYNDKIDQGMYKEYANPKKYNIINKKFIELINGFLLINNGIDSIGIKKLSEFIKYNYVNANNISNNEIIELINDYIKIDNENYIKQNCPQKLKSKFVFYPIDVDLDKHEKKACSQSYIKRLENIKIRSVLDLTIDNLENIDSYTKITISRISQKSQIQIKKVERVLNRRQKKRIKTINSERYFKSEKVTSKFLKFCQDFGNYMQIGIEQTMKDLSINKPSYYTFKQLASN